MFVTPPIIVSTVSDFISDEIHITGKQSKNPNAVLSFVPIDSDGNRISNGPVAIVSLSGEAYNSWYVSWNSESILYSSILTLLKNGVGGITLTGVDLSKLTSLSDINVVDSPEVLAPV